MTVGVTIHGTTAQTDSLAVFEVYKPIIDAVRTRLLQCETDVACLPAA